MKGFICVLLISGLLLYPVPAHTRTSDDYGFTCYGVGDGQICAGITYRDGFAEWADIYYSSPDGFASAYWQYGSGATVTYSGAYENIASASTGRFADDIQPAPVPPETGDCQQCIGLQTRLCYDIWDAESRQAGAEGASIATACLGLFELPPAMLVCMGTGLAVGISGQRAASKRLNACLVNGWRSCVDDQGRSCYQ